MTKYRVVLILALLFMVAVSAFAADAIVRQIEIKMSWGGLGTPQRTELVIRNDHGAFRMGRKQIEERAVSPEGEIEK